jgi:CRP/FNR family transcriptional regulator, cyclic AMP receptor protein
VQSTQDFLSSLSSEDRAAVESRGHRRHYGRGSVILNAGDEGTSVLILLEGRVKIGRPGFEGREAVLGFRGPGELIGEFAAIDAGPRSSSVAAMEPVVTLTIGGADFRRLVRERPGIASSLLTMLADRLRSSDNERVENGSYSVIGRVARRLVDLCDEYGTDTDEGVAIALPLTQEDLAGWTGASREAVSKALATLRGLGWVETNRRELVVTDIEALHTYAE